MKRPDLEAKQHFGLRWSPGSILACLLPWLVGCGPADSVEITDVRTLPAAPSTELIGATHAQRFGGEEFAPPEAPPSSAFSYTVPEGWEDAGPKSMREINLTAGDETQCYVIVLAGDGGGLLPNLNRWRGEVGLEPIDEAGMAALEKIELLGTSCPLLEVSGDYQGMGGSSGAGRTVLGIPLIRPQGSVFVKMVGPAEEVAAHRQGFFDFIDSIEDKR